MSTLDPTVRYERSPSDALRLVAGALVVVVGVLLASAFEDSVTGFERDLIGFFGNLPAPLERALIGLVQVTVLVVPVAATVGLLVRRRVRALGYALLGAAVAYGLDWVALEGFERFEPSAFVENQASDGWVTGARFPNSPTLAAAMAAMAVLTPWMSRPWRRAAWWVLWLAVIARLLASTVLPATLVMTMGLGWLVGAAVLVAFGSPRLPVPVDAVVAALARSARPMTTLRPASVDARGSTPYFGQSEDGSELFVKVLTDRERSADLLFRLYRWARFRNLGDERPFSSLRRTVEHEAVCSLAARDAGIRTPRLAAVAAVDPGGHTMVLAYERIAGRSLDGVPVEALTDDVLAGVWRLVAELRERRIAHRDLRLANVFLSDEGEPWLIDFGFSELAARDEQLASDVAELLASSAVIVGAERATRIAVDVVGREVVASALPRLQPNAMSGATRSAYAKRKSALDELREAATRASGADAVELEKLERFSARTALTMVALVGVFYFLVPQLTDLGTSLQQIKEANLEWTAAAIVFSLVTYLGAALSFAGAIPTRLPFGLTFLSQMASTFTNRITPAQAGGYALNVRFLQKCGVETPVAITGVGLNTLGGVVVHVPLMLLFFVWAGADGLPFAMPSSKIFVLIAVAFALIGVAFVVVPALRKLVHAKVLPALRSALAGIVDLAHRPAKLLSLLGGSFIVTMSYTLALVASVEAFGGGVSIAAIGFAYLAGSAVATAAPTPGGLGAAEAALIAGLTVFDLPHEVAVPAVFLFRIVTFWLPILPGWLCFRVLQNRDAI